MFASIITFLKALPGLIALLQELVNVSKLLTQAVVEYAEARIEQNVKEDLSKGLEQTANAKTVEEKRQRLRKIRNELQSQ